MKRKTNILFLLVVVFALCLVLAACDDDHNAQGKLTSGDVVAEGAFAEGTALLVSSIETTDSNYAAAISKIADKEYDKEKVAVFDISLEKDNAKVQPNGKVKITMPAPFDTENGYVTYHISGDTVEELATFLADGRITFETSGFSCFVVAGTTGGSVIGPGGDLNPNDPSRNFFAYVDTYDQATMTANGTVVPKGGYSATMKEGDTVELVATAKDGYEMVGWYKNAKQSGSDERYDERNNPATFTYIGTEKMFVYARFDVIEYTITLNLNGGAFKEGEEIPATYNVESDTITLPTLEKGATEFLGWKNADGEIVTEIAKGSTGDITLTATWKASTYVRVDKDKNPAADGEYILFGSYPQKKVAQSGHQSALETALSEKAGDLPVAGNNGKWTSFKYYYTVKGDGTLSMSNDIDFMWYIDVEHNGEKYRGVYFTDFRPEFALGWNRCDLGRDPVNALQYKNGYPGDTVYWFKYEPILWKIIAEDSNRVQLLSMSILDSQAYCTAAEEDTDNKIYTNQEKDEWYYAYYNITPGVPTGTVATNYKYSNIRSWLNDDFYGVAFDEEQKELINDTTLDNKSVGLGENTTDKVFLITLEEAGSLGSNDDDAFRDATDYATGLGANVNKYYSGCSWYLRESFNGKLSYDSGRYGWVCFVNRDGTRYSNTDSKGVANVMSTMTGVVPSLWITL